MTFYEYKTEVQDLARQIRDEAREDDRDVDDVLHETVDGHAWVIYTYRAVEVMQHASNPDAYQDLGIDASGGWSQFVSQAAYCALAEDVRDALADLEDEDEDEDSETAST